jgi:folate-binding protein YgfZ
MAWNDALATQYEAATTATGVVNLDGWTTLRITGADRAKFLHNMCTADVLKLPVGGQCEAFLTDVKGKIIGHGVVLSEAEQLTLITVPGQGERLIAHLDRYIIREDVRLTDATAAVAWSLVVGPRAGEGLTGVAPETLTAPCTLIWPGGFWVGASSDGGSAKPPATADLRQAAGIGDEVWHSLRIESGWPLFGVDFDSSHLPQEVGRDIQAINFKKGCYLGQETIARIDALGHVNKRLATVRLDAEAAVGAELVADGQAVGAVSSVGWSPQRNAWIALAMLRRGHNKQGAKLECLNRPAEVVPTPAVDHFVI